VADEGGDSDVGTGILVKANESTDDDKRASAVAVIKLVVFLGDNIRLLRRFLEEEYLIIL